jgi:ABC-2 type transport system permease protein
MRSISYALPPSYVFENLRAVVSGHSAHAGDLAVGGALALLDIAIAGWLFGRVYRNAVRTGLIARYSAESVS